MFVPTNKLDTNKNAIDTVCQNAKLSFVLCPVSHVLLGLGFVQGERPLPLAPFVCVE